MHQDDGTWSRPRLILALSQFEALVGCDESVAAVERSPRAVDADLLHGVCLDAIARLEAVGRLSAVGDCALAQGCHDHGRTVWSVDADSIYRTSRKERFRPEVGGVSSCLSPARISVCSVESRSMQSVNVKSSASCVCHGSPLGKIRTAGGGVCLNFSLCKQNVLT